MKALLLPVSKSNPRFTMGVIRLLLIASGAALLAAPLVLPASYSWIVHTTSESAAQGVRGAWVARLGFLCFGLAVVWLAASKARHWARGAVWLHVAFGVFMVATAAFSHRPWLPEAAFDPVEDLLHSITATGMGFAFALGVLFCLLQRDKDERLGRGLDGLGLAAATLIPLGMTSLPSITGLLQRLMFLIAYLWYANETRFPPGAGARAQDGA